MSTKTIRLSKSRLRLVQELMQMTNRSESEVVKLLLALGFLSIQSEGKSSRTGRKLSTTSYRYLVDQVVEDARWGSESREEADRELQKLLARMEANVL